MYFGHNEEDEEVKSNPLVKLLTKKNIFIGLGILLALIITIIVIVVISNSVKNNKNYTFELVGPSEINISLNDKYIEIGYLARDINNNNLSNLVSVEGNVDTTKEGSYNIKYTLSIGNKEVSINRIVNVVKTNDLLTLILKGNKNVSIKSSELYQEEGYSAVDSEEGDLNGSVKISNNIDYSTPGTYTIIYYVTNSKGITKVAYRNVNITD